jgi:soluble lytic murein transglycosylase-like protein
MLVSRASRARPGAGRSERPSLSVVRLLPVLLIAAVLAGCGGDRPSAAPRAQTPVPTATATPTGGIAAQLAGTTATLRAGIRAWLARDGGSSLPPAGVSAAADRQERLYLRLAARPRLAARVLPQLHGRLRAEARDVIAARRDIAVLNRPRPGQKPPRFVVRQPEPAAVIRAHYRAAERRYGVDVALLAAIHFVESRFGRVRNDSVAGAQGPMQFMPSTWAAYGLGGDVHDPHDAILGAANYLHANGAPGDDRGALFHYNPSSLYVDAVSRYAERMRRDPLAFYAFYAWPVRGR